MRKAFVNLGCGTRYSTAAPWINIDIAPAGAGVMRHDLSRGIPLAEESCSVVYHSHLLEHLRRDDARTFLLECRRVLEPGGIIRIATPDLERICRDYLDALGRGDDDDAEWMRIELYDQAVRERSGGAMKEYFEQESIPNLDFVRHRIGVEADAILAAVQPRARRLPRPGAAVRYAFHRARTLLVSLLGARRAYEIGAFRLRGEVHQWLYDQRSLAQLLQQTGFTGASVQTATSSSIDGWASFHLDTLPDGRVIKPDSMFVEARRV